LANSFCEMTFSKCSMQHCASLYVTIFSDVHTTHSNRVDKFYVTNSRNDVITSLYILNKVLESTLNWFSLLALNTGAGRHVTRKQSQPNASPQRRLKAQQQRNCWKRRSLPWSVPRSCKRDETTKREPRSWGYNWATLLLMDINTWNWPSRLRDSRI
jgi:hypothetical protein